MTEEDDYEREARAQALADHAQRERALAALYVERDKNPSRSYFECKGLLDFLVHRLKIETIEYQIICLEPGAPSDIEAARQLMLQCQRRLDKYMAAPLWKRPFLNFDND